MDDGANGIAVRRTPPLALEDALALAAGHEAQGSGISRTRALLEISSELPQTVEDAMVSTHGALLRWRGLAQEALEALEAYDDQRRLVVPDHAPAAAREEYREELERRLRVKRRAEHGASTAAQTLHCQQQYLKALAGLLERAGEKLQVPPHL